MRKCPVWEPDICGCRGWCQWSERVNGYTKRQVRDVSMSYLGRADGLGHSYRNVLRLAIWASVKKSGRGALWDAFKGDLCVETCKGACASLSTLHFRTKMKSSLNMMTMQQIPCTVDFPKTLIPGQQGLMFLLWKERLKIAPLQLAQRQWLLVQCGRSLGLITTIKEYQKYKYKLLVQCIVIKVEMWFTLYRMMQGEVIWLAFNCWWLRSVFCTSLS